MLTILCPPPGLEAINAYPRPSLEKQLITIYLEIAQAKYTSAKIAPGTWLLVGLNVRPTYIHYKENIE